MSIKILGIQDFSLPALKWLDTSTSSTWLRALEKLPKDTYQAFAVLREPNCSLSLLEPIQGIYYSFIKQDEFWSNLIKVIGKIQPDCILYNCWEYGKVQKFIETYRQINPTCKHILRTHHEVARVLNPDLMKGLNAVLDSWVVSNDSDIDSLNRSLDVVKPYFKIPFGVDVLYFVERRGLKAKNTHFVACAGTNPVKQHKLLQTVFSILQERGYMVRNILGAPKDMYAEALTRSNIYVSLSTSEASGSRSLLEALSAGAYPVVWTLCESARLVLNSLDYGSFIDGTASEIADALEEYLKVHYEPISPDLLDCFAEDKEIETLVNILSVT